MKYYGKKSLSSFLKIILIVLLLIGTVAYIGISILKIPDVFNLILSNVEIRNKLTILITYILFLTGGIAAISIVFHLIKIVDSLIKINPFVQQNVISLKKISIDCFIICGNYIINFFVNDLYKNFHIIEVDLKGIHTDGEFLLFFFGGCFVLILSHVFKQAVEAKEENDFTI